MDIHEYYRRLSQRDKALHHSLPVLLRSCLDGIDAAIWLIAGYNYAQALAMLHNCIELAFKAELASVHPILIADLGRKTDYETLKSFLTAEILTRRKARKLIARELDVEKTIPFSEAQNRVSEMYPSMFETWASKLTEMQRLRNDVTHYGAKESELSRYASVIATTAFPFLIEFLKTARRISLKSLVGKTTFREINVAQQVAERLKGEGLPPQSYVLYTIGHSALWGFSPRPQPEGESAWEAQSIYDFEIGAEGEKKVSFDWSGDYYAEAFCRICDSVRTFVKVDPVKKPKRHLVPMAVYCPKCNLRITDKDKYLAQYHIGNIGHDATSRFFDENMNALKYDGW